MKVKLLQDLGKHSVLIDFFRNVNYTPITIRLQSLTTV